MIIIPTIAMHAITTPAISPAESPVFVCAFSFFGVGAGVGAGIGLPTHETKDWQAPQCVQAGVLEVKE